MNFKKIFSRDFLYLALGGYDNRTGNGGLCYALWDSFFNKNLTPLKNYVANLKRYGTGQKVEVNIEI